MVGMSLEEFKEKAEKNPQGFQFLLVCLKCKKSNVAMEIEGSNYGAGGGCDSCGYGGEGTNELNVLIKCKDCGNAFKYEKEDD